MQVEFTAHNIRLDDGTFTKPETEISMEKHPWFVSAKGVLECMFPAGREHIRLADVGCLEGGYAVEFARMGFQVLGIEVREANIMACQYVKSKVALPNLNFVLDDAVNIAKHGVFDAVFCCGLLYHLNKPKEFFGFDLVFEQFDSLRPNIVASMVNGHYRSDLRGTFIGIKTK